MTSHRSRALSSLLLHVIGWTAAAALFTLIRYYGLGSIGRISQADFGIDPRQGLWDRLLPAGAFLGTLFWLVDRATLGERARDHSWGVLIFRQAALRTLVLVALVALLKADDFSREGLNVDLDLWRARVFSLNTGIILAYGAIVSLVFAFVREAERKFGPGNLVRMLLGKYHRPREESRVFAFLDLKSSTTLAERLGHVTYSRLVQDCFRDLAVVAEHGAEVYQYVGDEAVLCWPGEAGLRDAACLRACYRFFDRLEERRGHYEAAYGVQPFFKAGLHCGVVTVAEVGEIKREIAYHGDVLNTAARTQAKCNEYGAQVLVTEQLVEAFGEAPGFAFERKGQVELRGKAETVGILAVRRLE